MKTTHQLRETHRHNRQQIEALIQTDNANKLCQRLSALTEFNEATHVAAYIAIRGEISLEPTLQLLARQGKKIYLPV